MEEGLLTPFGCIVQQTLLEVHPLECHVFVFFFSWGQYMECYVQFNGDLEVCFLGWKVERVIDCCRRNNKYILK